MMTRNLFFCGNLECPFSFSLIVFFDSYTDWASNLKSTIGQCVRQYINHQNQSNLL